MHAGILIVAQYKPTESIISKPRSVRMVSPGSSLWRSPQRSVKYLSLTLPPHHSDMNLTAPCDVMPIKYHSIVVLIRGISLCSGKKAGWVLNEYFKAVYYYYTCWAVLPEVHRHGFTENVSVRSQMMSVCSLTYKTHAWRFARLLNYEL